MLLLLTYQWSLDVILSGTEHSIAFTYLLPCLQNKIQDVLSAFGGKKMAMGRRENAIALIRK